MNEINTQYQHSIESDEIDLIEILSVLYQNKLKFLVAMLVSSVLAVVFLFVAPKQYQSKATFFVNSDTQAPTGLGRYSSMLGLGSSSNVGNLIVNVVNSESIKLSVVEVFRKNFEEDIKNSIAKNKLINRKEHIDQYLISKLSLHSNISLTKSKDNLFTLKYHSTNIDMVKPILDEYLNLVLLFNSKLEISAMKDIITIIDKPTKPLGHFKPSTIVVLLGFNIVGLIGVMFFVLTVNSLKKKIVIDNLVWMLKISIK